MRNGTARESTPSPAPRPPGGGQVVAIEDLHVDYPTFGTTFAALRGIDLTIQPGEIVALVGESGAGKTTLARAIMRLVAAPGHISGGRVKFAGRDLASLSEEVEDVDWKTYAIIFRLHAIDHMNQAKKGLAALGGGPSPRARGATTA